MPLTALGQRYRCYRLADAEAEEAMAGSLRRWGQASPVVACAREGRLEIVDGFKRWTAAPACGWTTLSVQVVALDERLAKAAILGLNSLQRPTRELEEAWIVQALVRDDGLTQQEAAHLLGRHKSWVCRRLAFLERLGDALKEEMRLGLLGPALARQLLRLPAGNQEAVLAVTRREALTAQETAALVDLLQGAGEEQARFLLAKPREALQQARALPTPLRDPRLSCAGQLAGEASGTGVGSVDACGELAAHPGRREWQERDRDAVGTAVAAGGRAGGLGSGTGSRPPRGRGNCARWLMNDATKHEIVVCQQAGLSMRAIARHVGRVARHGGAGAGGRAAAAQRGRAAAQATPAPQHHR